MNSHHKKAVKIAVITGISIICLVIIIAVFQKKPYEPLLLKEANALRDKLETEIQGKPNAADDYLKAKDVYVKFSKDEEKELSEQHDNVLENGWKEENKKLREHLKKNEKALRYLNVGIKKKHCLLPKVDTIDQLLPELMPCRGLARLKVIRGKLYESQGQYNKAMNEYLEVIKLGKDIAIGEVLIHKLVSIAIESIGLRAVREIAQMPNVSDNTLKEAIVKIDNIKNLEFKIADTYKMEFIPSVDAIDIVHKKNGANQEKFQDMRKLPRMPAKWPVMNYNKTLNLFDRAYQDLIRKASLAYPESVKVDLSKYNYAPAGNHVVWMLKNINNIVGKSLISMLYPSLEPGIKYAVTSEAEINITVTILALELYKRENGQYPESLDSLVPAHLQTLPKDPFTTKSLIYRKDNDKYTLYSCGVDMDDDGGKITYSNKIPEYRDGDLMF